MVESVSVTNEYDFDSSDEEDVRNTVGNIPAQWYSSFGHIGYDTTGRPIMKSDVGRSETDIIDEFISKSNTEENIGWRTVKDPVTGQLVVLSDKDLETVTKMAGGKAILGDGQEEGFEPWIEWFSKNPMEMPVTAHPPQKRSFIPSLLDKRRVGRMVHAIKQGWIKPQLPSWALEDPRDTESLRRYAAYLTSGNAGALDSDDEDDVGFPTNFVSTYVFPDVWEDQQTGTNNTHDTSDDLKTSLPVLFEDYRPPRPRPFQRASKETLPGHNASYNPPPEFLLSNDEERQLMKSWREQVRDGYASHVPPQMPKKFDCLRHVPFSETFLREREERIKDLVMAARIEKQRLATTPEEMLPQLPSFSQLRPYPSHFGIVYRGHSGRVTSLSISPCGQWLASISPADGCLKIWETSTNYCFRSYTLVKPISQSDNPSSNKDERRVPSEEASDEQDDGANSDWTVERPTALVCWNPNSDLSLIAASIGDAIFIINPCLGDRLKCSKSDEMISQWWNDRKAVAPSQKAMDVDETESVNAKKPRLDSNDTIESNEEMSSTSLVGWNLRKAPTQTARPASSKSLELQRIELKTDQPVISLDWHAKGDYLLSLSRPLRADQVRSRDARRLLLHRLSTMTSQSPFLASSRLSEWRQASFHPVGSKPRLFVASSDNVRIFDLAQQQELRCLRVDAASSISCMSIHPSGEHLVTGSFDSRFNWFDVDLGNVPFKKLKLSHGAIRQVHVHRRRPLVSVAMDDGTLLIVHATASDDLLSKPTIIPVQLIRTGQPTKQSAVFSTLFHPNQPHVYSGGADGSVRQFVPWN